MSNTTMNKFNNIFNTKKEEQKNEKDILRKEIEKEIKEEVQKEIEEKYKNLLPEKEEQIKRELEEKLRKEIAEELRTEISPIHTKNKEFDVLSVNIKNQVNEKLKYFDEIVEDREISEFLKIKSSEMLLVGVGYTLQIGKIADEVFQKLGKQGSKDGLYLKWVQFNGYSESTLKRYRNHWEIFKSVDDNVKPVIALLTHSQVSKILKNEDIRELVYSSKELTLEDIKTLLDEEKLVTPLVEHKIEVPDFDFDKINNFLKNVENIEESKRNKIFKLMNQINKLIEE